MTSATAEIEERWMQEQYAWQQPDASTLCQRCELLVTTKRHSSTLACFGCVMVQLSLAVLIFRFFYGHPLRCMLGLVHLKAQTEGFCKQQLWSM